MSVATPSVQAFNPGQEINGFRVVRVVPLPHMHGAAYQFEHKKTGAKILHVHTDDSENLFSITFPTLPRDDTGIPHILEHAVLAGSRKYRVKDPFFQLTRMSMATFINAMTGPDLTYYPVSSNVRQDLFNLAEVYCDAVFHPNLTDGTFQREGHHLEFATPDDPSSPLLIKGIVYNEMKGVYSDPENILMETAQRRMFPDSVYGRDSGGDPKHIPDLTARQLRAFHQTFYHPSNALIFLYGDIPTADYLDFLRPKLDEFDKKNVDITIHRQQRWQAPRSHEATYPADRETPAENGAYISMHYLVGQLTDIRETLELAILSQVLLGNQGAPLRTAIIESKLGQDLVSSGFDPGTLETRFHIGIKGSEADRAEAFVKLVETTLARIADEGVPQDLIDAAMQQMAYSYQEIQSGYPLWLLGKAVDLWAYGVDPLTLLNVQALIDDLRGRLRSDPKLLSRLIREKLLSNPHRLTLVLKPDREMSARAEAEFAALMDEKKRAMSDGQKKELVTLAADLKAFEDQPDDPQAVAALPQLRVAELPRSPRHIPTEVSKLASGAVFLRNDVFANGVNYVQMDFDLTAMPKDLRIYLPLYCDCVRKMGAAGQDYARTAQRIAAQTGGVSASPYIAGDVRQAGVYGLAMRFGTKALDGTLDQAMAVLHDLVFAMEPEDKPRLRDVLLQGKVAYRSGIASQGAGLSINQSGQHLGGRAELATLLGGLPHIRFVDRLADVFDSEHAAIIAKLVAIGAYLRDTRRVAFSFTGTPKLEGAVRRTLESWNCGARSTGGSDKIKVGPFGSPLRQGLAGPMDVAYCAQSIPAPHVSDPSAMPLMLGAGFLGRGYLLEEIRFKGTAYGGGGSYNPMDAIWRLHSYRDPWVNRTLDVFRRMLDVVRAEEWSQTEIDHTIIATAKDGEKPIRPEAATSEALGRFITNDSRELREARHTALLSATASGVRRITEETLLKNMGESGICVVSSREKLENANRERPNEQLAIEDIFVK